jgi:DNA-binding transcriptional ArsR family regulator
MVHYADPSLDAAFAVLADATRRGILEQLALADASISDLARAFRMTLTGMKKHVALLERVGLVSTAKVGRVRTCTLGRSLAAEAGWIEAYRQHWEARFDALDQVIDDLKREETDNAGSQ